MSNAGRPPLPDEERKAHTFRIRMTDADRDEINAAAESAGVPSSEWARDVLLRAARKNRTASGERGS